mmetsp:Transcript_109791/g.310623  ORF Transcript_109791/g.310623 Transcript_109791/m.310623 type:complete len:218 (+) Transcript_109791:673-1326(+)
MRFCTEGADSLSCTLSGVGLCTSMTDITVDRSTTFGIDSTLIFACEPLVGCCSRDTSKLPLLRVSDGPVARVSRWLKLGNSDDGSPRENSSIASWPTDVSARDMLCRFAVEPAGLPGLHLHMSECVCARGGLSLGPTASGWGKSSSKWAQHTLSSVASEAARERAAPGCGRGRGRASTPGGGIERKASARACVGEGRWDAFLGPSWARRVDDARALA